MAGRRQRRGTNGVEKQEGVKGPHRAIFAAAAVLTMGLLGPSGASAEPNDTMATAQGPMTGSFASAIDTENDADWYFVYAASHTQLDVGVAGLGPDETCFQWQTILKDSDGYELSSTSAGFNEIDHIRYTLPDPGRYYLEVTGFLCYLLPGSYRIDLAASPALLTNPPPMVVAASRACRRAERRVIRVRKRLRHARSHQRRHRLRKKLRRARRDAARRCQSR